MRVMSRALGERHGPFDQLWEALDDVPEGFIGEIVAGEIVVSPRPHAPHIMAASGLGGLLMGGFQFGKQGPGAWIILVEPRIRFVDEIRVPDLAAWRLERFSAPETGPITVIPDWICEVLSRGTVRSDRLDKMPLYARHGIGHLWIVDPVAQLRLHAGNWSLIMTCGVDDKVRAEPFDAIELDLTQVWGPRRELDDPADP